jgi:hypothetical protein
MNPRSIRTGAAHTLVALLLLLTAAGPRPARADCPTSNVTCYNQNEPHDQTITSSTTAVFAHACDSGALQRDGSYDAPNAIVRAALTGDPVGQVVSTTLDDQYTLSGVASGTTLHVSAVADMHYDTYTPSWALADSNLSSAVGSAQIVLNLPDLGSASVDAGAERTPGQGWQHFEKEAQLEVPFVPGVPYAVAFIFGVIGHNKGQGTGSVTFHFAGLPPGATITSCRGYAQTEQPTPTLARSWGSVKATYR